MPGRFGLWLARGLVAVFTISGFNYVFHAIDLAVNGRWDHDFMKIAVLCFLTATVSYVGDQITTAIRELKGDQ